jgi:hypothetical protein
MLILLFYILLLSSRKFIKKIRIVCSANNHKNGVKAFALYTDLWYRNTKIVFL